MKRGEGGRERKGEKGCKGPLYRARQSGLWFLFFIRTRSSGRFSSNVTGKWPCSCLLFHVQCFFFLLWLFIRPFSLRRLCLSSSLFLVLKLCHNNIISSVIFLSRKFLYFCIVIAVVVIINIESQDCFLLWIVEERFCQSQVIFDKKWLFLSIIVINSWKERKESIRFEKFDRLSIYNYRNNFFLFLDYN